MQFGRPAMILAALTLTLGCGGGPAPAGPAPSAAAPAAPAAGAPTSSASSPGAAPSGAAPVSPAERQTLQYGYNPILAGTPMYIAQDRGISPSRGWTSNLRRLIQAR